MVDDPTDDALSSAAPEPASRPQPASPSTGRGRSVAAMLLSFLWPGAGQAYRGNARRGLAHALPILLVALAILAAVVALGPLVVVTHLLNPTVSTVLGIVLVLAGLLRAWSLVDAGRPLRGGNQILALILVALVALSHAWAGATLLSFYRAGQQINEPLVSGVPGPTAAPGSTVAPAQTPGPIGTEDPAVTPAPSPLPGERDRVTILLVGADNTHGAGRALTDTLMVASFDPIAQDLVMISIPRDTARFPLYGGGEYGSRINTLLQAAARDPERFPDGGMGTLVNEVEYLVGVPIDYYAQIDIAGFRELIDSVGGIDVVVERVVDDPGYQFTPTEVGFHLEPGPVHLDGKYATAFVRSRHGSSDYDRARRQQQVLLALRAKLNDPGVLVNLPAIVDAVSEIVRTDAPLDRLPDIVSIVQRTNSADTRRFVLGPPEYAHRITRADGTQSFATQLDLNNVGRLSVELFGELSRYASL